MSRLAGTLFRNRRTAIELLIGLRRALQKETGRAKKTTKLRPWTATEIYKLKGLAKKKVDVEKIARAWVLAPRLGRHHGATAVLDNIGTPVYLR
jgi:hypothetical protein